MKLKGKISLLVGSELTRIEIEDANANIQFLRIKLTPEQLSRCLSRESMVDCEIEVAGLDLIGKEHQNDKFTFEIPKELNSSRFSKELQELANSKLKNGWVADNYFSAQNSFSNKGDKYFAHVTIRRWI